MCKDHIRSVHYAGLPPDHRYEGNLRAWLKMFENLISSKESRAHVAPLLFCWIFMFNVM